MANFLNNFRAGTNPLFYKGFLYPHFYFGGGPLLKTRGEDRLEYGSNQSRVYSSILEDKNLFS